MGEIFSPSTYNTQLTLLNSISFTKSQILWLYATRYGSITVLFAISSIFCIFTLHKYVAKRTSLDPLVFCYAIQFVVSMLIGIIMLFGDFIEHNPIRVFRVGILMGTILSGLVTYDVVANLEKSKFAKKAHLDYLSVILLIGIIILMVVLSLFSTYTSPFNYAANSQTTSMDIMGVKWLNSFNSYTDTKVVVAPQSQLTFLRYQDYLSTNFTYGEGMLSNNRYYLDTQALPSHFGYGGNISIFDSLHRFDKYVLIFQIDRLLYHVYPTNTLNDIAYWSAEDFKLLESDSSANKIYYNGETEVLKV
ncbi:hypothetical protein [uncultured Methanomethylovorans sp.]|uniref:hypothetical protein n=1 Tax=uncultured Methanomethylovorans sp. TaxID=183759 RepID=UPI003749B699